MPRSPEERKTYQREWTRRKRGWTQPVPRECTECGAQFTPPPFHPRAATCSRKCNKRRHYLAHKEHVIAKSSEWQRLNPEKYRAILKRTQAKNPELYRRIWRIKQQRRNALMAQVQGVGVSATEWLAVIDKQKGKCWWCAHLMTHPTMDHVVPICRNGHHEISNIVAACKPCNSRKRDRLWPLESGALYKEIGNIHPNVPEMVHANG